MTRSNNSSDSNVLVVRKIDKEIYKRFRQKAIQENKNVGEALNQAMNYWLEKEGGIRAPDIYIFLKLNGLVRVRGAVQWSEEIDKSLYGETS